MIKSRSNPLVRLARSLHNGKARSESGLFLVEGIHNVGEVLQAGWDIEAILYAPESLSSSFARDLITQFAGNDVELSPDAMRAVAEKENPQGLVAIVRQRHPHLKDVSAFEFAVAVITPQDPGNVGTILRTLDAVGGSCLFVVNGGVDIFHPGVVRASMGACFWIPMVETGFDEFDTWRKGRNCQLVGTSSRANVDHRDFKPTRPWILLLGSEQKGLTVEQVAACDIAIRLPMRGRATSLNLAVAAGVLLYDFA